MPGSNYDRDLSVKEGFVLKKFLVKWEMILVYIMVLINVLLAVIKPDLYFTHGTVQSMINAGLDVSPLVLGMVDAMEKEGIRAFGPRANAAIIEGSKAFSKELMKKYNIPTANYEVFTDSTSAIDYIKAQNTFPTVIKADGLALGKGVIIAQNLEEAEQAVHEMIDDGKFGKSGSRVVIEEFLTGPEVSVLAFTDGKTVKPMVSAQDHKRAYDNDEGLNTGGMVHSHRVVCMMTQKRKNVMKIFLFRLLRL